MLTINQALEKILASSRTVDTVETITIDDALGRTLAQDQQSSINVPPADNSAMDGYALNTNDINRIDGSKETRTLPISQVITAGNIAHPLTPKTSARIFTGAEIPAGANAVVMQENCQVSKPKANPEDSQENKQCVTFTRPVVAGDNIRRCGQDISAGTIILPKGHRLQPQDIGLLATIGTATIPVYRHLSVAILSTGNELVTPGSPLKPGQIYNSNKYLLKSFLQQLNINILDLGTAQDNLDAIKQLLQQACDADCIISSGGVSVGEEDYIKQAVMDLGSLDLWKIAVKPGKPLGFGWIQNTPFFGLPGNPVSTLLTFLLFVKPFLLQQQGQSYHPPRTYTYRANFSHPKNASRQEYLRVTIDNDTNTVSPYHNQSSGVLSSVVNANAFAIVPQGVSISLGDSVEVLPFEP